MTSLVSLEDVQNRLKLGDSIAPGIESLLLQLMDLATLQLESALRTEFDAVTDEVEDFYVDAERLTPFYHGTPALLLSRLFVDTTATFTVVEALTKRNLATGDVIDPEDTTFNPKKSVVLVGDNDAVNVVERKLNHNSYDQIYFRVTYSAGFTASSGVYKSVPQWLQDLALQVVHTAWRQSDNCKKNCAVACGEAINQFRYIIEGKRRYAPWAYDPLP